MFSASLVPVISFGENDLFTTMHEEESLYNRIQEKIIKAIGFPIPAFYGNVFFFLIYFQNIKF